MTFSGNLDSSMDSMEETRFKKKHSELIQRLVYDLMGDGMIGRETMFYFLRSSLISQSSEDDAEESVKN
ncbi:hypothetical protein BDFB_009164 [Asbolus verrucosus]|uniref:Uncharacterized protein n=1 Tax=Asbolus verrucosus TaxID=1661398 RepID=A0A482WC13_ASBVE|nr:hypothetical protein BDFB_009164 [Asbolus verrucosus]